MRQVLIHARGETITAVYLTQTHWKCHSWLCYGCSSTWLHDSGHMVPANKQSRAWWVVQTATPFPECCLAWNPALLSCSHGLLHSHWTHWLCPIQCVQVRNTAIVLLNDMQCYRPVSNSECTPPNQVALVFSHPSVFSSASSLCKPHVLEYVHATKQQWRARTWERSAAGLPVAGALSPGLLAKSMAQLWLGEAESGRKASAHA